jgi:hypothetical protein
MTVSTWVRIDSLCRAITYGEWPVLSMVTTNSFYMFLLFSLCNLIVDDLPLVSPRPLHGKSPSPPKALSWHCDKRPCNAMRCAAPCCRAPPTWAPWRPEISGAAWAWPFCGEKWAFEKSGREGLPMFTMVYHWNNRTIIIFIIWKWAMIYSHKEPEGTGLDWDAARPLLCKCPKPRALEGREALIPKLALWEGWVQLPIHWCFFNK